MDVGGKIERHAWAVVEVPNIQVKSLSSDWEAWVVAEEGAGRAS